MSALESPSSSLAGARKVDQQGWVGIDVGGTHTDIVVLDNSGTLLSADKVPSDPAQPLNAIRAALATVPSHIAVNRCVNGTTIALNSLLQRRLPRVALVATAGFGDILYIRRETKANIYDLDWRKPRPIVPRHLTFEVEERIAADGEVVIPLGRVDALLEWLAETDVSDVAVCLLHAYRNPDHEHAVREAIRSRYPEMRITLSSDVWPEWREFERTYNTTLNAALKPVVQDYLEGLAVAVAEVADKADLQIMHADGGVLSPQDIAPRPVLTLLSGTVAGALFGADVARRAGYRFAVSLDMGGTSTDIALSEEGQPRRSNELAVEWEGTLGFAGIDVESIGAGGGSIAWCDEAGGLHVGPMSAGADPGPACYGRGGERPALTDAYLLLGYLGDQPTIAGRSLNADAADAAFSELARRTGLRSEELWRGVYDIATSNLAGGVRRMTIERGVDPRDCALICFGGAGPLHALELVRHLDLDSALIPPQPGNGSARGLLMAPLKHSASQTFFAPLTDLPSSEFDRLISDLRTRAGAAISETGAEVAWYLSLRYRGQTRELTVELTDLDISQFTDEIRAQVTEAFHVRHEREFTFRADREPIDLVTLRCEASASAALVNRNGRRAQGAETTSSETGKSNRSTTRAFFAVDGASAWESTNVVPRTVLAPSQSLAGPAIILDVGSTILLPPGSKASVDTEGNVIARWTK